MLQGRAQSDTEDLSETHSLGGQDNGGSQNQPPYGQGYPSHLTSNMNNKSNPLFRSDAFDQIPSTHH